MQTLRNNDLFCDLHALEFVHFQDKLSRVFIKIQWYSYKCW